MRLLGATPAVDATTLPVLTLRQQSELRDMVGFAGMSISNLQGTMTLSVVAPFITGLNFTGVMTVGTVSTDAVLDVAVFVNTPAVMSSTLAANMEFNLIGVTSIFQGRSMIALLLALFRDVPQPNPFFGNPLYNTNAPAVALVLRQGTVVLNSLGSVPADKITNLGGLSLNGAPSGLSTVLQSLMTPVQPPSSGLSALADAGISSSPLGGITTSLPCPISYIAVRLPFCHFFLLISIFQIRITQSCRLVVATEPRERDCPSDHTRLNDAPFHSGSQMHSHWVLLGDRNYR